MVAPSPRTAPAAVFAPPVEPVISAASLRQAVTAIVVREIAASLGFAEKDIEPETAFPQYGVDSITGVDLVNRLNRALGLQLRTTVIFDYANVNDLVAVLLREHGEKIAPLLRDKAPSADTNSPASSKSESVSATRVMSSSTAVRSETPNDQAIAVIGMSGRFPGAADLDEFWRNVVSGRCSITEVPPERWSASEQLSTEPSEEQRTPCKWGGFLDGIDRFDAAFFNMSGREAAVTDPQQRLFLEECWKALESAGYANEKVASARCGVFVGASAGDYYTQMRFAGRGREPHSFWGNSVAVIPARIAYHLDLKGPSISIDTACSSSLTSLHLACQSLRTGECELAIAGGVYVSTTPNVHILASNAGMTSSQGQNRAFDDAADGFVPGEGVGAVVLKPLRDAIRDRDTIHGVIIASGLNQDGHTYGLTAPSSASQTTLIASVYERAKINPETISFVESHGTGTRLGDPIEFGALTDGFRRFTQRERFCSIGALKNNIGHAAAAAGVGGVLKVLLMLRHRMVPPLARFERPSRHLTVEGSPFYFDTESRPWTVEEGTPRRAAISAFGIGGTNAHVVIEEYRPEREQVSRRSGPRPFVLSAYNREALAQVAARLADHLRRSGSTGAPVEIDDLAYTLGVGRKAFEERAAFIASSSEEVLRHLDGIAEGRDDGAVLRGFVQVNARGEERVSESDPRRCVEGWVRGAAVSWEELWAGALPHRIPLPTYPLQRDRFWFQEPLRPSSLHAFEPTWVEARHQDRGRVGGAVVLFDEGLETRAVLRDALRLEVLVLVEPGETYARLDEHHYRINPAQLGDYQRLRSELANRGIDPRLLVHGRFAPSSRHVGSHPGRVAEGLFSSLLLIVQGFGLEGGGLPRRLVHIFESTPGETPPAHAACAGLLRTIERESPKWRCANVEIQGSLIESGPRIAQLISAEAMGVDNDVEVRYSGNRRLVRRFKPAAVTGSADLLAQMSGKVCLITGGAGGIGAHLAQFLTRAQGARAVLCGRSPAASIDRRVASLLGERVVYMQADVTKVEDVRRVVAKTRERFGQIDGVLHAAGVLRDALILNKTLDAAHEVLATKIDGALLLDEATREDRLSFFALFSSLSAVTGSLGQSDYAFANRFLDAFAEHRESLRKTGARSGRTLSVNWPLWQEGGMRIDERTVEEMRERFGLEPIMSEQGGTALLESLQGRAAQRLILGGDAARFQSAFAVAGLFDVGTSKEPSQVAPPVPSPRTPVDRGASFERMTAVVRNLVAQELGISAERIGLGESFQRYGMDSVLAVSIAHELDKQFGEIPKTLLFEHHNLGALADWIATHRSERPAVTADSPPVSEAKVKAPPRVQAEAAHSTVVSARADEPIAIIGLSGLYPGAGADMALFWSNLREGRDQISNWPKQRGGGRAADLLWGGFLEGIDLFDPLLFGMTPADAALVDPQERLFVETVWRLFEDAAYSRSHLRAQQQLRGGVGVFVGASDPQYAFLATDRETAALIGSSSAAGIANRASHFFDLRGPSVTINTACSSSLSALHMACESLRSGGCGMAVAGGVNLVLHGDKYAALRRAGLLGSGKESRSLGIGDGYLPGEGVGAVLLKPLAAARADGDRILGLIRSTWSEHGGTTAGYAIPNPGAQARALARALERAGVAPVAIGYVEVAANGSEVGDSIEIAGLAHVFEGSGAAPGSCPIGSVKSNIGHLEAASGISQLTKVLLQLREGLLVPTLHAEPLNPRIELRGTPFRVQSRLAEWPRIDLNDGRGPLARHAVISSFGAGGASAHVVLEEAPAEARLAPYPSGSCIVPLSARSPELLRQDAAALAAFLRTDAGQKISLDELAFTLQCREPLSVRVALVSSELTEVLHALDLLARGEDAGCIRRGVDASATVSALLEGEEGQAYVAELFARGRYDKLARLWADGAHLDWTVIPGSERSPRRVGLPPRALVRRRCWIEEAVSAETSLSSAASVEGTPGDAVTVLLKRRIAELTQLDVSEIDPSGPWAALGVNSLTLVRLRDGIEREFSVRVAMSVVGACRSVNELAERLRALVTEAPPRGATQSANGHALEGMSDGNLEELFARLSGVSSQKGEA
uniref:Trans-AT type I polyketide synthase n=1 Tax=Stigmatella aurantiaca TaxID=41 RepID=G8YZM3_STIAU|nr:trans-AT type I polyketide synthase [Stigmatella aurantiaca Sg a15]